LYAPFVGHLTDRTGFQSGTMS